MKTQESLVITTVENSNTPGKEYIVLSAKKGCDLKDYVISDTTFSNGGIESNLHKHTYRFSPKQITEDTYIILFTSDEKSATRAPVKYYPLIKLYMNLDCCIWNDATSDHISLWKVTDIMSIKVNTFKEI